MDIVAPDRMRWLVPATIGSSSIVAIIGLPIGLLVNWPVPMWSLFVALATVAGSVFLVRQAFRWLMEYYDDYERYEIDWYKAQFQQLTTDEQWALKDKLLNQIDFAEEYMRKDGFSSYRSYDGNLFISDHGPVKLCSLTLDFQNPSASSDGTGYSTYRQYWFYAGLKYPVFTENSATQMIRGEDGQYKLESWKDTVRDHTKSLDYVASVEELQELSDYLSQIIHRVV